MTIKDNLTGIQHVGIPTNDIEETVAFYEKLGFETALRTVNEEAGEKVAFLRLGTLVVETYENKAAKMTDGAIDHIAIDRDTIHFLPFWENGVRFFTIAGPNKERIEFSQYV